MAKLSARNQKELLRCTLERGVTNSDLIVWERVERVYMNNRRILEKRTVRFKSDGKRHDWGWTVYGKVKAGITATQVKERYEREGWHITAKSSEEFK